MIDTQIEPPIPLAKAARKYASARGQGTVHPATMHRWRTAGLHGIRLDCIKVGGAWCTTEGALQRFFEALTAASRPPAAGVEPSTGATTGRKAPRVDATTEQRRRHVEHELDMVLGTVAPAPPKESRSGRVGQQ